MTDDDTVLRRLIGGDPTARDEIVRRADADAPPELLVAAALVTGRHDPFLSRAGEDATSPRDRQLVAVAEAHLARDPDRLDALVRDHLADHPDSLLAAWIAAGAAPLSPIPTQDRSHHA